MKALLAYIPVWHAGYQELLNLVKDQVDTVVIIDPTWARTISEELDYLRKEIRALSATSAEDLVKKLYPQLKTLILDQNSIEHVSQQTIDLIIAPDEDVSRVILDQFFPQTKIEHRPIFLRWDKHSATTAVELQANQTQTGEQFAQEILKLAYSEAGKSSDWWRHIGAVLIRDNQPLLLTHNTQLPNPQESYIVGDSRSLFHKGEWIDLTSAIHAEAGILAQAAKQGIKTDGCDLLATTFPCPPCAKLIAQSGIKTLYFCEGYAMFDGEAILKAAGVEIIKVKVDPDIQISQDSASQVLPYPS